MYFSEVKTAVKYTSTYQQLNFLNFKCDIKIMVGGLTHES